MKLFPTPRKFCCLCVLRLFLCSRLFLCFSDVSLHAVGVVVGLLCDFSVVLSGCVLIRHGYFSFSFSNSGMHCSNISTLLFQQVTSELANKYRSSVSLLSAVQPMATAPASSLPPSASHLFFPTSSSTRDPMPRNSKAPSMVSSRPAVFSVLSHVSGRRINWDVKSLF